MKRNMKKLFAMICTMCMLIVTICPEAMAEDSATNESLFTYTSNSSGGITITGFTGNAEYDGEEMGEESLNAISIPEYIDGQKVTKIGERAFDIEQYPKDPDTGATIANLEAIDVIIIPEGVQSIGYRTFYGMQFQQIVLPSTLRLIDNCCFQNCSLLEEINIPASVYAIGSQVFDNCCSLIKITVDSSNVTYNSKNNCNAIIKTYKNELIYGCRTTVFPSDITKIGQFAFSGILNSKEGYNPISITIPDGVTQIDGYAFSYNSDITEINLPDSITAIGANAFRGGNLEHVVLPSELTSLENYVFRDNISLKTIKIGPNVTKFGSMSPFFGCNKSILKLLVVEDSDAATYAKANGFTYEYYNELSETSCTHDYTNQPYIPSGDFRTHYQICKLCSERSATVSCTLGEVISETIVEPTCNTSGSHTETQKCTLCDAVINNREVNDPATRKHDFTSDKYSSTGDGKHYNICKVCSYVSDFESCVAGTPVLGNYTEPTCKNPGTHTETFICTKCNYVMSVNTVVDSPATGDHSYRLYRQGIAGTHYQICEKCASHSTPVSCTPGDLVISSVVAPTCDKAGSHYEIIQCKLCDYILMNEKKTDPATGVHNYTDQPYVSSNDGSTHYQVCKDCGTPSETENCIAGSPVISNVVPPSCDVPGSHVETTSCICGYVFKTETKIDAVLEHNYSTSWSTDGSYHWHKCTNCDAISGKATHTTTTTTTKATTSANGKITYKCKDCNYISKTTTISKINNVTLSATSYAYTGSAIKPSVTVKDANGTTIAATNYTIAYSNNKNVGKGKVTITFKNNYSGTLTKTFNINPTATSLTSVANVTNGIQLKWNKNANATGYKIYRSTNGAEYKLIKTITSNATVSYTDTGATTNGNKQQYKILVYKTVGDYNYCSKYSSVITRYRVTNVTLTVSNAVNGINLKWTQNTKATGYKIYRSTNDGDYKLLKTITNNTTLSYADTGATTNGNKYRYKVIAYKTVSGTNYNSSFAAKVMYKLAQPTISSVSNTAAGKVTVKWSANSKATGYEIKYVTGSTTKTVKVTSASTVSKVLSLLKKGSTYKISIRTYKTVSGTTYYSAWSSAKSIKITK